MPVESDTFDRAGGKAAVAVRMLGPMAISREGLPLALPASRKVRALVAYLALAPHAVTRSQLCEPRVHEILLDALGRSGSIREGEEHLAATIRLFETEGLDSTPIRDVWRAARAQAGSARPLRAGSPSPASRSMGDRSEIVAGT